MSFGTGGSSGSSNLSGNSDVALNNPASNQALQYDVATAKWKNAPIIVSQIAGLAPLATSGSFADVSGAPNAVAANVTRVTAASDNTYPARPSGAAYVEWVGTQPPTGATQYDVWLDMSTAQLISVVSNELLSDAQSHAEVTDVSAFSTHGGGVTLSVDTTWAAAGTKSIKVAVGSSATHDSGVIVQSANNVETAGASYVFKATARRGSGTTPVAMTVKWRDSSGAIAASEVVGTQTLSTTAGSTTAFTSTLTAPSNATAVHLIVRYTTTPSSGEYFNVDELYITKQ